jgi:hypothetical protein
MEQSDGMTEGSGVVPLSQNLQRTEENHEIPQSG